MSTSTEQAFYMPVELLNAADDLPLDDDFSEEEMLRAVRDAGFDFRRSRSGHVFLLNVQGAE